MRHMFDALSPGVEAARWRGGQMPVRGGLAPYKLRHVTDYCDRHLAETVAVSDLAALVGLSAKHFARAFAESTGQPPHRWLIARRIAAARCLLADTNRPLSAIALDCGFADQSHFTACFRRFVGLAPGRFRRLRDDRRT